MTVSYHVMGIMAAVFTAALRSSGCRAPLSCSYPTLKLCGEFLRHCRLLSLRSVELRCLHQGVQSMGAVLVSCTFLTFVLRRFHGLWMLLRCSE
jgi:hypothetical protein